MLRLLKQAGVRGALQDGVWNRRDQRCGPINPGLVEGFHVCDVAVDTMDPAAPQLGVDLGIAAGATGSSLIGEIRLSQAPLHGAGFFGSARRISLCSPRDTQLKVPYRSHVAYG